jgi:hypothetical protein
MAVLLQTADRQREDLERRQLEERAEFGRFWESPTTLLKYSKPSPELLDMREVQRRMTIVMDFAGAEDMKREADALEGVEAAQAQVRAVRAMKIAAEQLRQRQEREKQILEALIAQRVGRVEAEKVAMKAPVEKTLRHVNDPGAPRSADASPQTARSRSALVSPLGDRKGVPRTFRKQAVKREDPVIRQLPVKALKAGKAFRSSEPGSARRRSSMS